MPYALCASIVFLIGCAPVAVVELSPSRELLDETVVSPQLKAKRYKRIMVIPPSGTARGQFDREIALFERELLKSDITVVAGAVTGRIVLGGGAGAEKRLEAAKDLSDAERALVMAKETGADALLQLGGFGWSEGRAATRFVVLMKMDGVQRFREVSQSEYQGASGAKLAFLSPVLSFVGRLMDVESGQVVASFKIDGAANWSLPVGYTAQVVMDQVTYLAGESFVYGDSSWVAGAVSRQEMAAAQRAAEQAFWLGARAAPAPTGGPGADMWLEQAKKATVERVIQLVGKRIMGG
jgi:hypothetical protein